MAQQGIHGSLDQRREELAILYDMEGTIEESEVMYNLLLVKLGCESFMVRHFYVQSFLYLANPP